MEYAWTLPNDPSSATALGESKRQLPGEFHRSAASARGSEANNVPVRRDGELDRAIIRRSRLARALQEKLSFQLIPHRYRPGAEFQPIHELQVDIL